ncbi:extensin isoform X2 [Drosophila innubila]|uniref:extensin isoform X2 n=1 Tax=Drosophila innubila TaxID=198719 RepID=UPI00148C98B0|nr:extensin isoform X2 [Drosophila innubila]XP_034481522.1 extensin isoform X2 [Drosophila innubila]
METALDVLSRAATMVQNNASETRLTSKELPTTKWRRERRQRAAAVEYQVHDAGSGDRDRERERERERTPDMDSPIDMSVTSSTVKHQRASPPPPYREPLAGAGSHCYAASRPSVITQAPPKREQLEHLHSHSHSHSSRELENRSTESDSICDIDEHFRRSLGPDYAALLKSPTPSSPTPSPQPQSIQAPSHPQPVAGNGVPMQQISPLGYRQQPTTYQQHHSPLSLPLPLALPLPLPMSKMGLPTMHSPTLHSAPVSPQHELPPPQEEPLSLSPSPVRAASASPPSPPTTGVSQILDMPVTKRERALDTPHHTPPRYNTPPPAYGSGLASTPTPPTMPAIIRVKAEPGLAAASSTHTPPASPTSSTNISIFTKTDASVDDHFAKALGDTWKKLQGQGKE